MTKYVAPVLALVAAALSALPAAASARSPDARLIACHPAVAPVDRSLTVEGEMLAGAPGERMQMRFQLLRRSGAGNRFVPVAAPGLGVFKRAHAGVGDYRFRKTIRNLPAPADYRVQVTFRWLSATGAEIARLARPSPVCHQVELRPDLRLGPLTATTTGQAREFRYTVEVRNAGGSTARGFHVALGVGDRSLPPVAVERLAPGQGRSLTFTAAACAPGDALIARADSRRRVSEASETNNVRALPCPAVSLASA